MSNLLRRRVVLQYGFLADDAAAPFASGPGHPLFNLLQAVRRCGSIQHAARSVGASYRHVWGALKHWEQALGEPLLTWAQGQPARLTPFADRLLDAETMVRARRVAQIGALQADLALVMAEALDGERPRLSALGGHDAALDALRDMAADAQVLHLDLQEHGCLDGLRAFSEGKGQLALLPVPTDLATGQAWAVHHAGLLDPANHSVLGFAFRQQGLMTARGNPLRLMTWADLDRPGLRWAGRQPGSATHWLTHRLKGQAGISPATGLLGSTGDEPSAVAAAAAIATGRADAGLGTAAAAASQDLAFSPWIEERCWLVARTTETSQPALFGLAELLASPEWAARLSRVPGTRPAESANWQPLTQAWPAT